MHGLSCMAREKHGAGATQHLHMRLCSSLPPLVLAARRGMAQPHYGHGCVMSHTAAAGTARVGRTVRNSYHSHIFVPPDGPDSGPRVRCPTQCSHHSPNRPVLSATQDVTHLVCATIVILTHVRVVTSLSRGRLRSMTKEVRGRLCTGGVLNGAPGREQSVV